MNFSFYLVGSWRWPDIIVEIWSKRCLESFFGTAAKTSSKSWNMSKKVNLKQYQLFKKVKFLPFVSKFSFPSSWIFSLAQRTQDWWPSMPHSTNVKVYVCIHQKAFQIISDLFFLYEQIAFWCAIVHDGRSLVPINKFFYPEMIGILKTTFSFVSLK